MKRSNMNFNAIIMIVVAFLFSSNGFAQAKNDIATKFFSLEEEVDQLHEKYSSELEKRGDFALTDEEKKEIKAIKEAKAKKSKTQRIKEFVNLYKDVNGKKNLEKILKSISREERRAMLFVPTEDVKNMESIFKMQRERATIEHKMYELAKQYLRE